MPAGVSRHALTYGGRDDKPLNLRQRQRVKNSRAGRGSFAKRYFATSNETVEFHAVATIVIVNYSLSIRLAVRLIFRGFSRLESRVQIRKQGQLWFQSSRCEVSRPYSSHHLNMADTNGALCQKSATYDGKEYQVIREGLAEILKPGSSTEQNSGCSSKPQTVFYNPIQQFNRDLSVLAIRAFAEDLALIRRRRKERASGKAKHRGNKRKRPDEEQHAEHATPSGKSHKASSDGEQRMNGMPEELDANSKVVKDWAPIGKSSFTPS